MYKEIFTDINLTPGESIIYEHLLKNGESPAGDIIKKTALKRGLVYKILTNLTEKGLVIEKKSVPSKKQGKRKISHFLPNHPEKLREFIDSEKKRLDKAKNNLEANLPAIISDFNLVSGKPGVRFFEGIKGIKEVLNDTLINNYSRKILTFSDLGNYVKYLKDWNTNYYAPKRRQFQILEKAIVPDDPVSLEFLKEYLANPEADRLTAVHFIDYKLYPFKTEINVYENKVSIVSFSEKNHIGVIIENKEIFESMVSIFNAIWDTNAKQDQSQTLEQN